MSVNSVHKLLYVRWVCFATAVMAVRGFIGLAFAAFWIVELHNLTPRQLGVASTAVGVAELLGEFAVILVGDRISECLGSRRAA